MKWSQLFTAGSWVWAEPSSTHPSGETSSWAPQQTADTRYLQSKCSLSEKIPRFGCTTIISTVSIILPLLPSFHGCYSAMRTCVPTQALSLTTNPGVPQGQRYWYKPLDEPGQSRSYRWFVSPFLSYKHTFALLASGPSTLVSTPSNSTSSSQVPPCSITTKE